MKASTNRQIYVLMKFGRILDNSITTFGMQNVALIYPRVVGSGYGAG